MKTTNFEVKNRKIERIDFTTHTGEYNVDTFKFNFDEEWNELDKTLVIVVNDKTYNIAILNDEAILPKEAYVDSQRISIGVFGKKEDILLASNLIEIWMTEGAYKEGEEPENLPTPTQWDLYIQEINTIVNHVEELANGLDDKVVEVENKLANGDFLEEVKKYTEEYVNNLIGDYEIAMDELIEGSGVWVYKK